MSAVHPSQAPSDAVPSTAAVNGHPIHPMIVGFPIAFLVGALVTDILFAMRNDPFWAMCSYWLLIAGVAMGVVAAIFGIADFLGDRRVKSLVVARLHFAGNAIVLAASAINIWLRLDEPTAAIVPVGIAISAAVVALLTFTGWLGGEMAYRHRVGVVSRNVQGGADDLRNKW